MTFRTAQAEQTLMQRFFAQHPDEAAKILEKLPTTEIVRLLAAEPPARAASLLDRLTSETAGMALEQLAGETAGPLLSALDPAHAAMLLARLDEDARNQRLNLLDAGTAREIRSLLAYPPDTAGSLMDPRVTTFHGDTIVEETLTRLRTVRRRPIHDLFLVDTAGRLAGTVALQDVALASSTTRLAELVRSAPVSVQAIATREEVVEELTQRRLTSLPVVDFSGMLLGVLRYDALVLAVQAEASADIQTMVGASKEERALSPVSFAVRKRLPWLQINLVTAFLAAAVVGLFEDIIARFTALAVLLPVVAGQSGNTGAQALAVTMRGLAMREIRTRQWPRVSLKEINVAGVNGVAVALTTALGVYVWSWSIGLTLVIGISMVISMAAAGLAGAVIPMMLTALGQDPAQSSSIVLTTVTDVVGFFSFLGIATALAGML
ncbi:MAG: magnesium transporter [Candidatus Binatia bacterium]